MRKANKHVEKNQDPYEDIVRLENLDAYESLINSNLIKKKNQSD